MSINHDDPLFPKRSKYSDSEEQKNHVLRDWLQKFVDNCRLPNVTLISEAKEDDFCKRSLRDLFRANCNQLMVYFLNNFAIIDSTPRVVNLDGKIIHMAIKLDQFMYSTRYFSEETCPRIITIVGSDTHQAVCKTQITLIAFQLLIQWLYVLYRLCHFSSNGINTLHYDTGLIFVMNNVMNQNLPHPFLRLVLNIKVASNLISTANDLLQKRHTFIGAIIEIIFSTLHLEYSQENVDNYIVVTSRPNKMNFHLHFNGHLDVVLGLLVRHEIHSYIYNTQQEYIFKLDEPTLITLPMGREHLPFKFCIGNNCKLVKDDEKDLSLETFMKMSPLDLSNFKTFGLINTRTCTTNYKETLNLNQIHVCICNSPCWHSGTDVEHIESYSFNFHSLISMYLPMTHRTKHKPISYSQVIDNQLEPISPHFLLRYDFTQSGVSYINFIYDHSVIYSIDRYLLHLYICLSTEEFNTNSNENISLECTLSKEFYEFPLKIFFRKHYNFHHYDIQERCNDWSQNFTSNDSTLNLLQQLPRHHSGNRYSDTTIHLSDLKCFPFTKQQCYLLNLIETKENNTTTRNDWHQLEQQVYHVLVKRLALIDKNYLAFLFFLLHRTNLKSNITDRFIHKVVEQLQHNARFIRQRNNITCGGIANAHIRSEKREYPRSSNTVNQLKIRNDQAMEMNNYEDYIASHDYLWLKTVVQICFNCGAVTSTISAFYRYTEFDSFFDCIYFVLQTFHLTTHAKYILSKWALMSPTPSNLMSMSFRYTDWPFCLFHYANIADNDSAMQNKQFMHARDYISNLFILFQQLLNAESIPFADNYQDFFFRHICGLQSLGNQRLIIFYAGKYHSIYENELKTSCAYNGSSSADHYEIDNNSLNYFTFHEVIGLLNPLFNVYELAAPSIQTLVGIKLHSSIPKIIRQHHLAMRTCPQFQKFIFLVYAKCKPFIDLCCQNVLLVALLCPIANRSIPSNNSNLLPLISYQDESFIVLLNDFSYLQKKFGHVYWNETFLEMVISKRNLFTYYMKRFILLFYLLTQKYNCNFQNIIVFIQLLFGNDIREQIGLPHQRDNTKICRKHNEAEETGKSEIFNNKGDKDNVIFDINNSDDNECLAICRYHENPSTMTEFIKKMTKISKLREKSIRQKQQNIIDMVTQKNPKETLWQYTITNQEKFILENNDLFANQYCQLHRSDFSKIVLTACNTNHDYQLTQRDVLIVMLNFDNLYCDNEAYDQLINQINLHQQHSEVLKFSILLVSWCIRMGRRHQLSETKLFAQMFKDAPRVYNQLKEMLLCSIGPILKFSKIDALAELLKAYCENTVVDLQQLHETKLKHLHIPDLCILTDGLNHETQLLKRDYSKYFEATDIEKIIDQDMIEKLQQYIYQIFSLLIVLSEFNFDVMLDYLKFVMYLLFKGNNLRICLYIYGVTQSCKSRFAEMCESIMQTGTSMSFNSVNMAKNPTQDYDSIVVPGAFNNLLIFDEIDKISISRFKTIINTATMSTRDIRGNDSLNLKLSCTPLLTSNKTFSADEATCSRLHVIKKFMQFCPPAVTTATTATTATDTSHFNIQNSIFDRYILDHTSEKRAPIQIGAMILTRKLPEWIPHNEAIGLYMLQHYLLPLFFHHPTTPISSHISNTMRLTLKRYIVQNYPLSNFLENVRIDSSSEFISAEKLYDIVHVWWNNSREKFRNSDTDCNILFNELQDYLSKFKGSKNGLEGYNIIIRLK